MSKLHLNTISSPLGDALVKKRYPWGHDRNNILKSIERCNQTTDNTDVICLKNKYWEFIVEDLMDAVANL